MDKYTTKSTSLQSAEVIEPIILEENITTRKIFRAVLNDTKLNSQETVSGHIIHQRKSSKDEWRDVKSINLNKLKCDDDVGFYLHSAAVKKFYDELTKLYHISSKGVRIGTVEYVVGLANELMLIPEERRTFIKNLLDRNYGEDIWRELVESLPDLATKLSLSRIQYKRQKALEEFEENLNLNKNEAFWQSFFARNQWIFGYGLDYRFLNTLSTQPNYGGQNYEGKGGERGDFLLNSMAKSKFTILVEIKTPQTQLLHLMNGKPEKYRNGAWKLGSELLYAVSQIQTNCKSWSRESTSEANINLVIKDNIYTMNPKGILILGHSRQFEDEKTQIETFEQFRRSLYNPEIFTFDELYERAKFIVEREAAELEEK